MARAPRSAERVLLTKPAVFREWLGQRREAYQRLFDKARPEALIVLRDLAEFCHAHESTMHPDVRAQAAMEGERGVWLRIQHHLQLSNDQFWELYGAPERDLDRGE